MSKLGFSVGRPVGVMPLRPYRSRDSFLPQISGFIAAAIGLALLVIILLGLPEANSDLAVLLRQVAQVLTL